MNIETALAHDPEAAEALAKFKEQLLLVFLKRLGRIQLIPTAEVDDTENNVMTITANGGMFTFELRSKSSQPQRPPDSALRHHNEVVVPIVQCIIGTVAAKGGNNIDLFLLLESVCAAVLANAIRNPAEDAAVLTNLTKRVRIRMARIRLANMPPAGTS